MRAMSLLLILACALLLPLVATAGATPPRADERTGEVNFVPGRKMLDKNDWGDFDKQFENGAEVTWGKKSWPILIATDALVSTDTQTLQGKDVTVNTYELAVGVRKIWNAGKAHPYVGGGAAFLAAELKQVQGSIVESGSTSTFGGWVGGGIFWRLGRRFNLGFAARASSGSARPFDKEISIGGTHAGIILGWGWPASK